MKKNKTKKQNFTSNKKLNDAFLNAFETLQIKDRETQLLVVKIIKFIIVGGIATLISGIIFFLCDTFLKIGVLYSNTIAFCISVIYNYWASCKYVFEVDKNKKASRRFIEFFVFALMGYGIMEFLLWLMADFWKWPHMVAWFIGTIIVMIFNFVTRQLFLEKRNK